MSGGRLFDPDSCNWDPDSYDDDAWMILPGERAEEVRGRLANLDGWRGGRARPRPDEVEDIVPYPEYL